MPDLSGAQFEKFRIGLTELFWEEARLQAFLREKLERALFHYAAAGDPLPTACFRVLLGAEAEGWTRDLCKKTHDAGPHNRNIAAVASELGFIPVSDPRVTPEPDADAPATPPLWKTFNPYRGMLALREQDADFLFGRDADVDAFIEAIATHQSTIFLALGASGVGKSSLIFAGVLGALNRRALKSRRPWPTALEDSHKWPHLVVAPGKEPVRSLAGAFVREWLDATTPDYREMTSRWRDLLVQGDNLDGLVEAADEASRRKRQDPPPRYLIYVDQGEELYTRGGREPGRDPTRGVTKPSSDGAEQETSQQTEARRFSELLAEAADHPRLVVLMSARSDFLGRLQADARLSEDRPKLIFDIHRQVNISPLSEGGLAEVVCRPAEQLGVSFETGLDKTLTAATRKEIGGLPLLSYTLETLWQEMQSGKDGGPILRWNGVAGEPINIARKLADRADAFLARRQSQEEVLRRLFCVRLAHVPSQGEPTRQRASLRDLSDSERDLVKDLADPAQRILTTGRSDEGQPIAEVAHEKLFAAWTTLRNWIESRRGFYAWATRIAVDRQEWEKAERLPEHLLIGRPLELTRFHLEHDGEDIPDEDRDFIIASIDADRQRKADAINNLNAALLTQSRFLADLSSQATDRSDAGLGVLLALEALPDRQSKDQTSRERPYWGPAEVALEKARRALRERRVLAGHEDYVYSVAVTPDGTRIVTGSKDNTARIWDAADGRELAQLNGHQDPVFSVAVTPDGTRIVTGSRDKTARIWDAADGRELAQLKGHQGWLRSVAVTPDGARIVTGSEDNTARIWNAADGRELAQLNGHQGPVFSVAVTPDGSRIVTGSRDKTARIWDAADGRELAQLKGHQGWVRSVAVTPDGARIVTGSEDNTARIWDAADGRELAQLNGHESYVRSVAVTPDGARIVTGSEDNTARIWDAADGRELAQLNGHESPVMSVAVTPDGARIVTSSDDNTARIWDAADGRELAQLNGHQGWVYSVAVTPDGARIVTGSEDDTARIWDATDGRELAQLNGHQGWVYSVAVTPDGSRIVTGSKDNTARIWDAAGGRELAQLNGHQGPVFSVAVTPDGARIVTGSEDNTARIWDAADGRELAQLNGHQGWVYSVAVTPDGARIVTGSEDNTARIWDAADGRELAQLNGHQDPVFSVAVTRVGSRIVTGSEDNTARIWDAAGGRELAQLNGHQGPVSSVAVTPDGARIVTGSVDNTARIWDAADGRELAQLKGHQGPVFSVAVTPDGARIVTGSGDTKGRIWKVFPYGQMLIDNAKINVPRCLTLEERERYCLTPTPPSWSSELGKWPYTATALFIDAKSLLAQGRIALAQVKFLQARKLDPSLGEDIDALLAHAAEQEEPR